MNKGICILYVVFLAIAFRPATAGQTANLSVSTNSHKGERVSNGYCFSKSRLAGYENRAKNNDLVALRALHNYYERGCQINDKKILYYAKKAAEVGTSYDIKFYAEDLVGLKGAATAFPVFLSAARQGNTDAIEWIADAYMHGTGTKKNKNKAELWSTLAAKKGCSISMTDLAYLLSERSGVLNKEKALAWLLVEQKILSGFGVDYQSERAKKLMDELKKIVPSYLNSTVNMLREEYEYDVGILRCK